MRSHALTAFVGPSSPFYLPLMHSELLADQDRCVRLHEAFFDPELLKYATLRSMAGACAEKSVQASSVRLKLE